MTLNSKRVNPFSKIYEKVNVPFRGGQYPDLPVYIDVELTNYCNFNCLMCPTGTKSIRRRQGFMSLQLYKKIVEEIAPYNVAVRFIRWGEPMLHPEFMEFVRLTKEANLLCHFNTNGSFLNEKKIIELLDLKVDSIKYSFQGTDEKTYSEMRYGQSFNALVEKIKLFHDLRGSLEYPFLHAATTTTYETEEMREQFIRVLSNYCDMVTCGKTKLEHINIEDVNVTEELQNKLIELKSKESIEKRYSYCNEVYLKLSVNWDGTVTACCSDYNGEMIVGDLKTNTLSEIYRAPRLNYYRKLLTEFRHQELPLCAICYDTMGIRK